MMSGLRIEEGPKTYLSSNSYATKKTVSQGMLDVALLTANASQLKYSLTMGDKNKFYYVLVILISLSIILQVLVGILFIIVGYSDLNETEKHKRLNRHNNISTVMVFVITVVNVFIAGFGMGGDVGQTAAAIQPSAS